MPELGLAFLTSTSVLPFPGSPYRRIRLDAAADWGDPPAQPAPDFASPKVSAALAEEAVEFWPRPRPCTTIWRALYNPFVDFQLVDQMAQSVGDEILKIGESLVSCLDTGDPVYQVFAPLPADQGYGHVVGH